MKSQEPRAPGMSSRAEPMPGMFTRSFPDTRASWKAWLYAWAPRRTSARSRGCQARSGAKASMFWEMPISTRPSTASSSSRAATWARTMLASAAIVLGPSVTPGGIRPCRYPPSSNTMGSLSEMTSASNPARRGAQARAYARKASTLWGRCQGGARGDQGGVEGPPGARAWGLHPREPLAVGLERAPVDASALRLDAGPFQGDAEGRGSHVQRQAVVLLVTVPVVHRAPAAHVRLLQLPGPLPLGPVVLDAALHLVRGGGDAEGEVGRKGLLVSTHRERAQ